jgi:high affinity sulfate transporter 1
MRSNSDLPTAPSTMQRWFPIGVWLKNYDWRGSAPADLIAAVSVAALLIPESMGYASVAGVPSEIGLYAAPLALVMYAMFGGSRLLVFGAAGSVAAVSASVVGDLSGGDKDTAVAMTAGLALAAGAVFIVAGLAKMGWITNFISKAVMSGFIVGLSIQIIVGQFGKLFGVDQSGDNTFSKLWSVISDIGDWTWAAAAIGVGSLVLIFAIQRFVPKVPAALAAVVATSLIVAIVDPDIDLVAEIPEGLPSFGLPSGISASDWLTLVLGGCVVALVGFSEGWGASKQIAVKTHDELDTNQEFRAYGAGNVGAGLLGGMVVTGSLSKSAAAEEAGAKSQMTGIMLAGVVLLTLAFLAPAFQWLPEAALAAIVINAMSGSASPSELKVIWKVDRIDFVFGMATLLVVLAFDLLPAMITGIVLSVTYMVYRVSFPGQAVLGQDPHTGEYVAKHWMFHGRSGESHQDATLTPDVIVFRFSAPLIFSNAEAFQKTGEQLLIEAAAENEFPKAVVIDFEEVYEVDSTGAAAITSLFDYAHRYGVELVLARVHSGTYELLKLAGVVDELGAERIHASIHEAVAVVDSKPTGAADS